MLDWKRIDKHPPPKDGRMIALCDTNDEEYVVAATWRDDPFSARRWYTIEGGHYKDDDFTHWAEIGPLPTTEPGHERS